MMLKKYNLPLLVLPFLIFLLGIFTLYSISPGRVNTQLIAFLIGAILYFLVSVIDYSIYKYYWKYIYIFTIVLLVATFLLGQVIAGSARWLTVSFINLQPSEFAKITVIIGLSAILALDKTYITNAKKIPRLLLFILPILALVFVQPDLGTTLLIFAIFLTILLFAGFNKIYLLILFIIGGIASSPLWQTLQDYQKERILVFLNPALDVLGSGYNVIQSQIAIGSGGLMGLGFGRGTQSHLKFLPAYWTDFIFASFAEEWGFIGVSVLLTLFALLFIFLIYSAFKIEDAFGSMIIIGCFVVFFGQFIINVGMNLGIMPVTGIPLPLVSYGGSSLVVSSIMLGLVQSVWVHRKGN